MKNLRKKDFYKEKIIEMVTKIEDVWVLRQILRCIKNITKEGG